MTADPEFEQYRDDREGGCSHFRDPATCPPCAADEKELRPTRLTAAQAVTAADEAMTALRHLASLLVDLNANELYREFYGDTTADEDSWNEVADAQRAVRSFARIARERAARTEQQP